MHTWQTSSAAVISVVTTIEISRVRPMYTSDIENRRHRSLLQHRRRQVADVDVVKIEFAGGGICGGRKTTALNNDVKTRFF